MMFGDLISDNSVRYFFKELANQDNIKKEIEESHFTGFLRNHGLKKKKEILNSDSLGCDVLGKKIKGDIS